MSQTARDEARAILADPRAPEAERLEAQAIMERDYRPTSASDLIPSAAFQPVLEAIRNGDIGGEIAKADNNPFAPQRGRRSKAAGMRAVKTDEMQIAVGGDYIEPPGGAADFGLLRRMVEQTPILAAVVTTRIRQMSRYCQPSEDGGPGFLIRHMDKEHEPDDGEKEQMQLLTRFFQHCGWEWDARARKRLKRDTFPNFMSKLMRDSLTFDACPFETEMTRDKKGIDGLYAVDGATIRLCVEDGYEGDDEIFAVQVVNGKVATTFTLNQLVYEVRNPRSDVTMAGYGFGETELLLKTVTMLLNAVTFNGEFFDKNSIPKGLLQIVGDYSSEDISAFKRMWKQMVSGVENRYGLPVMVSKDKDSGATYTPFNAAADEMAFSRWITFLTSVVCAVYCIDPSEIGFEGFATQRSSLSGSDTEQKMGHGKDKGLRPFAAFYEGVFTDFVVTQFDKNLCFRFEGMEEEDAAKEWEARKLVCTVDELRAEAGYGPMDDERIGSLPVNPALIQPAMQLQHPDAMNPQQPGDDYGPDAPQGAEQGDDYGTQGPAPQEGGSEDFGGEAPAPQAGGDDFGPEAPEPKPPVKKSMILLRRLLPWRA